MSAGAVTVFDAASSETPHEVHTEPDATLGDLRGLICSLALPSVETAYAQPGMRVAICHDGHVLGQEQDDATLLALGVLEAPVVVVLPLRDRTPLVQNKVPASAVQGTDAATPAHAPPQESVEPQQPEARTPAAVRETQPADAVCRICFGTAHENGAGPLISPCRCIGSMK